MILPSYIWLRHMERKFMMEEGESGRERKRGEKKEGNKGRERKGGSSSLGGLALVDYSVMLR